MAGRFENPNNIFTWLGETKDPEKSYRCIEQVQEAAEEKKAIFFQEMTQKKFSNSLNRQSSKIKSKLNKIGLQIYIKVRNHCFVSNITSPIKKMFMALIYLNNSQPKNNCWHRLMSGMKLSHNIAF